jgi:PAS domain-containing protein
LSFFLATGFILLAVVLVFARRLLYTRKLREMDKAKVIILEQSQIRLQELLHRISIQENKTRSAVNAIRDFIICINKKGRIIESNSSFDKVFTKEMGNMNQDEMYVGTLFPELGDYFFLNMDPLRPVETIMKRKNDDPLPVLVSVTSLIEDGGLDSSIGLLTPLSARSDISFGFPEDNELRETEENEEGYIIGKRKTFHN